MKINLQIKGLEDVQRQLARLSNGATREAFAKAVTDTAYQAQRRIQENMRRNFTGVTPYLVKSVLVEHATPESLSARVAPSLIDPSAVDPQKILRAQEFGGARRAKRYEMALRAVGVLPPGFVTTLPRNPFPGSADGRGNLRGRFAIELLNYFQAGAARVAALNKRKQSALRRTISYSSAMRYVNRQLVDREVKLLHGYEMFATDGTTGGLAPGIWARRPGVHREIKPVLVFVRDASYRPRLGAEKIAKDGDLQQYLERRLRYRIRKALEE